MEEEGKEKNGRKIKPERTRKNQKEKGRKNMKIPKKQSSEQATCAAAKWAGPPTGAAWRSHCFLLPTGGKLESTTNPGHSLQSLSGKRLQSLI